MNVLFLSLGKYWTINEKDIYTDLLREFIRHGDKVYVLSPTERREGKKTQLIEEENSVILKVRTGNVQKTHFIEKGISTILIGPQFLRAFKKYFSKTRFDLVLYPTPPITFAGVVEYVKKRDNARTYLLLKDIFPQNAVDIGMMNKTGIKGLLYRHFRRQEKKLYRISDRIGCMSQANVDYVVKHNPEIDPEIVEVCPNCMEVFDKSVGGAARDEIRKKYGIPTDRKVFVYGGNLGKPQGIPLLTRCLAACRDMKEVFFLIVGDGTEFPLLEKYAKESGQTNFKLMKRLPREDYDTMVGACDVGLIFLDHRFTIPNFPSRLLGYMQAKLPILACTDPNTDIGKIIVEGGFGWWCESNNVEAFTECVRAAAAADTVGLGKAGYEYLNRHYTVEIGYRIIQKSLCGRDTK